LWQVAIDGASHVASQKSGWDLLAREIKPTSGGKKGQFLVYSQSADLSVAAVLRSRGDYNRALLIYERCLAARKIHLGENHADTLLVANAFAFTLHLKGDNKRALPLLEDCLAAYRLLFDDHDPNTVLYRSRRDACASALLAEASRQSDAPHSQP
jgi:hypothetical protein